MPIFNAYAGPCPRVWQSGARAGAADFLCGSDVVVRFKPSMRLCTAIGASRVRALLDQGPQKLRQIRLRYSAECRLQDVGPLERSTAMPTNSTQ